ncbi:hypothetical protein [Robiginitalea sp. SC105]|uniref:hypothetical protein n=1 Tax=Robiginitalea sp. SC105 TaxID=2762332 RepID=UPI00163A4D74|nr:hypothetical protein [Robiginitalea sp. SC105]MBC2839206.1 hypothetical protein [Robiginitalea sp. SC105]
MNRPLFTFLILALLGHYNLLCQADPDIRTQRIEWPGDTRTAVVRDTLSGYRIADYLFSAQAGQYLNISLATQNSANYFNLMEPGEAYEAVFIGSVSGNQYEGTSAKSGEYRIRVYLMRSAARRGETADFRLEVIRGKQPEADALVPGTPFHATGQVPCGVNGTEQCNFGVIRSGNGSGRVILTLQDGTRQTILFENGRAIGCDPLPATGEFQSSHEGDVFIIGIGDAQYEIPDAVIYGG